MNGSLPSKTLSKATDAGSDGEGRHLWVGCSRMVAKRGLDGDSSNGTIVWRRRDSWKPHGSRQAVLQQHRFQLSRADIFAGEHGQDASGWKVTAILL